MVHRPPDSRLLTNLIDHEREYTKHLAALFPLSNAALASLSAYAAASPAAPINPVVDALATANDALHRYTTAIDRWRQQLLALKDLEDDLAAVLRDRDILVTRLIKASKFTRDVRRTSRIVSASLSSLTLPSTTNSTSVSGPASTNPKLAQAQTELQACEAHLAAKEREIDARRISIARDGLGARCRALIDCAWVWSEMGKQGLKAIQALDPDPSGSSLTVPKPAHRRSTNPTPCASDNSSLTPSQSASQTAAKSLEMSHEGPASKELECVQPPAEPEPTSKPHARNNDDGDFTLTLPPAHAISELAFPTTLCTQSRQLENHDLTAPEPVPRRKRAKRSRRPPSQHIAEVSDEDPDETDLIPRAPPTPFPTSATHDTSSDDEHPTGPLQVVENDPFQAIRRSVLGTAPASPLFTPSAMSPVARASAPDVRASIVAVDSPSKALFPGSSLSVSGLATAQRAGTTLGHGAPPPTRRQRKTSLAFFGSLRGLFRKPRERGRIVATEWDESPPSASPRVKRTGWVTRTDERLRSRGGQEDSDEEPMQRMTHRATATDTTVNVGRAPSGARLRKGRPSASVRENGLARAPSKRAGADGWITDTRGPSASVDMSGAPISRSRTRGGTTKRKKISVADLRGSDQGHTDGELEGGHHSLQPVLDIGREKVLEAAASVSAPKTIVEDRTPATAPANTNSSAAPNLTDNPSTDVPLQRQAMTMVSSPRSSSDDVPAHRRSASLSVIDAHMTILSTSPSASTHTTSTGGSMSWRKPPPQVDIRSVSPSQNSVPVPAQHRMHDSQPRQSARRHVGNGRAKHVQNQSLMSIVADVTRQGQTWDDDRAKSLDLPRAPGSVLHEGDHEVVEEGNGWGHARTSSPKDATQGQRALKLPLRSALRNASRTPSPTPAIVPIKKEEEHGRGAVPSVWRDSASISSYQTGRESLNEEPPSPVQTRSLPVQSQPQPPAGRSLPPSVRTPPARTPPPPFTFPPPPVDPPPVWAGTTTSNGNANEPGSSGTSTEAVPVRRKSVRVSLQPTFSPPPPATYDEDDDGYRPGRSSGDVWADSSEEEETYSRARRMLSSVGRSKA